MNHSDIVQRLTVNATVVEGLVQGVSDEQARWKPSEDSWSILEVINHLYDEERDDFRTRLGLVLENPDVDWPPIDPEAWAVERKYNQRKLKASWQNFLKERKASVSWLQKLDLPNWKATHHHPKLGPMSAEQILANWLAHDLIHIRQLTALHREYLLQKVSPITLDYAGSW